jgi:hypothetical protein
VFIDSDVRAMIEVRFEFAGKKNTLRPGHSGGQGSRPVVRAARTGPVGVRPGAASAEGYTAERPALAFVVGAAGDHWQLMHAAATRTTGRLSSRGRDLTPS